MIILATDVLIEILDKKSAKGDEALEKILQSGEDISTTTINLHEILYNLEKYAKPVREILLLPVINYTKKDSLLSSKIKLEAETRGTSLRRTDAMIAAITINNGATLYTFNKKNFNPLENLNLKLFT